MQYKILIVIAFIISIIAAWLEISFFMTLTIVFVIFFTILLITKFYPILWTKNIDKTERYMKKNLKDPLINFYYVLANHLDDELEVACNQVMGKVKDPKKRALFQTIYSLYKKDLQTAKVSVAQMQSTIYQTYYLAAIAIEEHNFTKAKQLFGKIDKVWMKAALQCEIAKQEGKYGQAQEYAKQALQQTCGLQKYVLTKQFEREGLLGKVQM